MGHELTEVDGEVAMAFNLERGYPWHKLGTPIAGFMTVEQALVASRSNDVVTLEPTLVPGKWYTVSSIFGHMGVVGKDWKVQQRSEMMALAMSIVGMTEGEAVVDTMFNLGEQGQRFGCHVEFPELVIDPNGVADTIRRGLFVGTSFDTSMANIIGLSNIREVCANTVRLSLGRLAQAVKVKHTTNAEERMQEAAAAVGYAAAAERELIKVAERMLAIPGKPAVKAALTELWPINEDTDPKWVDRLQDKHDTVWELFDSETCAEAVGPNGWAAYNAVTEWLDHYRPVNKLTGAAAAAKRAEQTLLDDAHDVNQKKHRAANAILALAA